MGTPDKRYRRSQAELSMLDARIYTVLSGDHPQSVRHVFYRIVSDVDAGVDKTEQGYNLVQRRCADLRRRGLVPYGWISDATRRGFHVATFEHGAWGAMEPKVR